MPPQSRRSKPAAVKLSLVCAALLLPSAALADPLEVDLDSIGPRWLGSQYIDNLGWFVQAPGDLNGDGLSDFAVSSPQDDGPLTFGSTIRIFMGRASGPPQSGSATWADVEITDGKVGGDAVFQFAIIPDATGDGVDDILVTEPNAGDAGKVLLYVGSDGPWPSELASGDAVARWDGFVRVDPDDGLAPETRPSLAGAGDFDGDGMSDVAIVSALFKRFWVDYSDAPFTGLTSLADVPDVFAECEEELLTAQFGAAFAVGNFNDDNFDDMVLSAPGCASGEGRVFVWYGSATGLPEAPTLVIGDGDRLGQALNIGDLNGDGTDDLFVQEKLSSTDEDPNREGRGNLRVHFGGAGGLDAAPDVIIRGGFSDKRFGETIAMLPDVSNPPDGLPELVVGSPESAFGGEGQGAIHIFEGLADWTGDHDANTARYRVLGSHQHAWFGAGLAALDDFDGDGFPELVIGEPNYTEGDSENDFQRGRLYLFNALPDRDEDGDGFSTLNGDCDDTDEDVRPGAFEDCEDDVDNDCDRVVNDGCEEVGDDDDATDPPVIGDDDDAGECDCEGSLAAGQGGSGLLVALLGGFAIVARRQRRRTE